MKREVLALEKTEAARLAQQAKAGDMRAFEELVLAHETFVYRVVLRILGNEQDAWDVAQEVFLRAYQNMGQFDGRSAFSTWLYRIAHNGAIDALRRRKTGRELPLEGLNDSDGGPVIQHEDPGPSPEEQALQRERRGKIREALCDLPEDYRLMVILRDLEGLSYQEIAQQEGLAVGTVKSRVSRGRAQLKKALQKERELFPALFRHKNERKEG